MKFKFLQYLPFGFALLLVFIHVMHVVQRPSYHIGFGLTAQNSMLQTVFYAGLGLWVVFILILFKQKYWKVVFLVLVILSFTPFLQFYSTTLSVGINSITIDVTALGLLIFHLAFNPDLLTGIASVLRSSEKEQMKENEGKIKSFERRFSSKSPSELSDIVTQNQLVPEAVEAARRLLNKQEAISQKNT